MPYKVGDWVFVIDCFDANIGGWAHGQTYKVTSLGLDCVYITIDHFNDSKPIRYFLMFEGIRPLTSLEKVLL